ncbi:MAG: transcriptional repressor [Spirochaetales bacterium]|nr:transcriptional repressor [Spirochaetales bacterium]
MQLIERAFHHEREQLRQCGLKITTQRLIILKELMNHADHPTVHMIHEAVKKELPAVSVDTVYRTLLSFSEAGLCTVLDGMGEARRFDPKRTVHHHFICNNCGKIVDFACTEFDNLQLPSVFKKGFTVENKSVRLSGLCPDCNK